MRSAGIHVALRALAAVCLLTPVGPPAEAGVTVITLPVFVDSPCGGTAVAAALGDPVLIGFKAKDANPDEAVSLSLAPEGGAHVARFASFDAGEPGNPVTGTLVLAPDLLDWLFSLFAAPYRIGIVATDEGGDQGQCFLTVVLTLLAEGPPPPGPGPSK